MKFTHAQVRPLAALLLLWALVFCSFVGYGQVQMTELPLSVQILEPGSSSPMDAGPPMIVDPDGRVVFRFRVTDVDPLADDGSPVTITRMLVDNLGTATHLDVIELMCLTTSPDGAFEDAIAPVVVPGPGPNPNLTFEAECDLTAPPGSLPGFILPDGGTEYFAIAVRVADTSTLLTHSQNHTLMLQVTIQSEEEVGSPVQQTTFTNSITDRAIDYVWNGGINNSLRERSFSAEPIRTDDPDGGVVARFELCDQDGNGWGLHLTELILVQGPLGSARFSDIMNFEFISSDGTISSIPPTPDFDRGGAGFAFPINMEIVQDDLPCRTFEIRAFVTPGAMRGRTIHLKITFMTEEPVGFPIDPRVAPSLQMSKTVMIGSGILKIADTQIPSIPGVSSLVPIEIADFPSPGLKEIAVQTNSVQFDPHMIQIEGVEGKTPYDVPQQSVDIDNRAGRLHFRIELDPTQAGSLTIPQNQIVAYIRLSPTNNSHPGDISILLLQVDYVKDLDDAFVTPEVVVVSGSVLLLTVGDVDVDGIPTVSDALLLAGAIVTYCLADPPEEISEDPGDAYALNKEQKFVADVVISEGAPRKADPGLVPTCTDLDSADVARISELTLTFEGSGVSTRAMDSALSPSRRIPSLSLFERFLRFIRPSEPLPAQVGLTLTPVPSQLLLQIDSKGRAVGGLQGRIRFNPPTLEIQSLKGLNGYEVLASKIDNVRGEARFVVLAQPGQGSQAHDVLELEVQGPASRSTPQLDIEFLLDPQGQTIPYTLLPPADGTVIPMAVQSARLYPVSAVWKLQVEGQSIASIQIVGFDLWGRMRFQAEASGSTLQFAALDQGGRRLANGVYLYVIIVRGVSGEIWHSTVHKMAIIR